MCVYVFVLMCVFVSVIWQEGRGTENSQAKTVFVREANSPSLSPAFGNVDLFLYFSTPSISLTSPTPFLPEMLIVRVRFIFNMVDLVVLKIQISRKL